LAPGGGPRGARALDCGVAHSPAAASRRRQVFVLASPVASGAPSAPQHSGESWKRRSAPRSVRRMLRGVLIGSVALSTARSAALRGASQCSRWRFAARSAAFGALSGAPWRSQWRSRRFQRLVAALPKHSDTVGKAFFSCNG